MAADLWQIAPEVFRIRDRQGNVAEIAPAYRPQVTMEGSQILLKNRGMIVTTANQNQNVQLDFTWTWLQGGTPNMEDHLIVAFRTDGTRSDLYSFEATNGIAVRFNPCGNPGHVLVTQLGGEAIILKRIALAQGVSYQVRIAIKDNKIRVYVNDMATPLIPDTVIPQLANAKLSIYNREVQGGPTGVVNHLSELLGLTISNPQ